MLTEAKHTPGTWEAGVHPANHNLHLVRPVLFRSNVVVMPECEGGHIALKNGADARLIAAAKDMLEALQAAKQTIDDYLAYKHDGDPWTEDARSMGEMDINDFARDGRRERMNAAIAKATGA